MIEVSMNVPNILAIFNEFKREQKKLDLFVFHTEGCPPCKPIPGSLTLAEAERGVEMVARFHPVTISQVWITYESENYHRNWDTPHLERRFLGKLRAFFNSGGDHPSFIKDFYTGVNVLPLKMGRGSLERPYKPHFCKNIRKLSDNSGVLSLLCANTRCTSVVICLRSSHTEHLDYAFESFWPRSRDHLILLEGVLSTLREYLPSFKFASGKQLDEEISVVDVENSSPPIKILVDKMRKLNLFTNINNPEGEGDDDDDLVVFAVYKGEYRLLYLPSSPTFENVMEKVKHEFELKRETFKVEYQVLPGNWYSLNNDTGLRSCVSSYRTTEDKDHIKLCVLAVEK
ncbi:hypothetical protein L1987_81301 [Smallanthus sonchifolius]|uniref:Uncharacterized protein n=1 Tax=Smallanthus sonchifolius TaxID=185202 RepID=A0ACB8YQU1_9ASTR|nr:hypothetical protein L1987_81301 [Smallanthus sonchifolius]